MNPMHKISEQDIQRALRKFRRQGRLIRRLPAQVAPRSGLVGAKYAAYENPADGGAGAEFTRSPAPRKPGRRSPGA
jgi:hypothetical protein